LDVPWVYARHVLARYWQVPPWEVDAAPWDEVQMTLRIMALEAEAEKK
jgi:hypothetical protein